MCVSNCAYCENGFSCIKCNLEYELLSNGLCRKICKSGYYLSESQNLCNPCGPNCSNCLSSNMCLECFTGFFIFENACFSECPPYSFKPIEGVSCQRCPDNCLRCKSERECIGCDSKYHLQENGKKVKKNLSFFLYYDF